jgi:transcription termination factor Rho
MKYPQPRGTVGKKKPGRAQPPHQRPPQQRPAQQRSAPPHPSRRRPAPPPYQPPREDLPLQPADPDAPPVEGVLELHPRGFGFLRNPARSYLAQPGDPYVSAILIQKHGLAEGLLLKGAIEANRRGPGPAGPRLARIDLIEGQPTENYRPRRFDDLTPIDPHEQIILETGQEPLTTRVMDLLTPIGKGQRGLIVAPPRTGKTVLLQHIAQAVTQNHPEMHLILLLIDERPEEVTEFRRQIQGMGRGEVVASSSDLDSANHARTAEIVVERAKRLAEQGRQVFVLLDSLTRLARAYNKNVGNGGRTMSGGVDVRALEIPKRLFGSARVFEEGGSLTVLGTALIETGSRMDDVIFQEFKGTGNMELVLDRKLAERRVYPAMDVAASGTRKEERILHPDVLSRVTVMRRGLVNLSPTQAMEGLVRKLGEQPNNAAFLLKLSPFVKT